MCGRFFLDTDVKDIMEHYNQPPPDIFSPRYNIAPTTPVLACTDKGLNLFRWGLIPAWAKTCPWEIECLMHAPRQ